MNSQHIEMEKSLAIKIVECIDGLQLLRDSIRGFREGKSYYLIAIAGQLRALLIDKAKNAERRLLYVADKLGHVPCVYCMPGVENSKFLEESAPIFYMSGFPITIERKSDNQIELSFSEVLDRTFLFYNGIKYSPRTIIEWFANRAGGAHYSGSLPKQFAEMLTFDFGILAPMQQMLLQLAEATLCMGVEIIRKSVEQEVHLLIAIPKMPQRDSVLLDARYPDTSMRFTLLLDPLGGVHFRLEGLNGSWIQCGSNKLVRWESVRHLSLAMRVTDELFTEAQLHIDGDHYGTVRLEAPLFLIPDWLDFDMCHNKAVDGEPQDFSFCLAELATFGAHLSPTRKASMLLHEEQQRTDPNLKLIRYEPLSYARSAPGATDLTMSGVVKLVSVTEALQR